MAGAKTPQQQTIAAMEKAIREAGRDPMQRNTFYERIESTGSRKPHAEEPEASQEASREVVSA